MHFLLRAPIMVCTHLINNIRLQTVLADIYTQVPVILVAQKIS